MWGDGPSLLAQLAVARLRPYASPGLAGPGRRLRLRPRHAVPRHRARLPRRRHRRLAGGDRGGAQGAQQRHPPLGQDAPRRRVPRERPRLARGGPRARRRVRRRLRLQRLPPAGAYRPPGVRGGVRRRRPPRRPPLPQHTLAARPASTTPWASPCPARSAAGSTGCTCTSARPRSSSGTSRAVRGARPGGARLRGAAAGRAAAPPHELVPGRAPALSLRPAGGVAPGPTRAGRRDDPEDGTGERRDVQLAARVLAERRDLRHLPVEPGDARRAPPGPFLAHTWPEPQSAKR